MTENTAPRDRVWSLMSRLPEWVLHSVWSNPETMKSLQGGCHPKKESRVVYCASLDQPRSRKTISEIRFRRRWIDLLPSLLPPANLGYSLNRDFIPRVLARHEPRVSAADHPINWLLRTRLGTDESCNRLPMPCVGTAVPSTN